MGFAETVITVKGRTGPDGEWIRGSKRLQQKAKTDRSIRQVGFAESVAEVLRGHKRQRVAALEAGGLDWDDDGFVFSPDLYGRDFYAPHSVTQMFRRIRGNLDGNATRDEQAAQAVADVLNLPTASAKASGRAPRRPRDAAPDRIDDATPQEHSEDPDCTVDDETLTCRVCGVDHSAECALSAVGAGSIGRLATMRQPEAREAWSRRVL